MKVAIKGTADEIAALVVGLQGRQGLPQDSAEDLESRLVAFLKEASEGHEKIQYF